MKQDHTCTCGHEFTYCIIESNDPHTFLAQETIHCPSCNQLVHSGWYKDAYAFIRRIVKDHDEVEPESLLRRIQTWIRKYVRLFFHSSGAST